MTRRCTRLRERLDCLFHGHRDLSRAPAYGEVLAGLADKELHYCGACGGPVWLPASHEPHGPRTWSAAGFDESMT
ncbi:MAG TPA: hypothetical protein VFI31_19395 [Pirellulales bacterium]|nr:hypothetical protein [Pirellulales bacterium]